MWAKGFSPWFWKKGVFITKTFFAKPPTPNFTLGAGGPYSGGAYNLFKKPPKKFTPLKRGGGGENPLLPPRGE